jgi:hypothetical protein
MTAYRTTTTYFLYREGAMCTEKAIEHDSCIIQSNNDPYVEA